MRYFLFSILFLATVPSLVGAYTFQQGDMVTVTDSIQGDMYISASSFHHDTSTLGDVFSFSDTATIDGTIEEDLFVLSQSLDSLGAIGDDAYILTSDAQFLDGEVVGDLFVIAQHVTFAPQFRVTGSCIIFAQEVFIQGEYTSCRIVASKIWIDAIFQGDVRLTGQGIYITPQSLFGSLHYASPKILDESLFLSQVKDDISYTPISSIDTLLTYFFQGWRVYHILFTVIISLFLLVLFPQRRVRVGYTFTHMTLASVVSGLLWYIFLPLLLTALFFSFIGIPIALLFGFLYLLSLLFFEVLIVCTVSKGLTHVFFAHPALWSAVMTFLLVISLSGLLAMIPYNFDILLGIIILGACLVALGRK